MYVNILILLPFTR